MSDDPDKKPPVGVQNWRQPGLPGVNAPLPDGAKQALGPQMRRKLGKILGTFNSPKQVREMAPYATSAEELREAILLELSHHGLVGPSVAAVVSISAVQIMWSQFLFDRAAVKDDPKLAEMASRIGDASKVNLMAAHALHAQAQKTAPPPRDPLDAFPADPEPPEPEES